MRVGPDTNAIITGAFKGKRRNAGVTRLDLNEYAGLPDIEFQDSSITETRIFLISPLRLNIMLLDS